MFLLRHLMVYVVAVTLWIYPSDIRLAALALFSGRQTQTGFYSLSPQTTKYIRRHTYSNSFTFQSINYINSLKPSVICILQNFPILWNKNSICLSKKSKLHHSSELWVATKLDYICEINSKEAIVIIHLCDQNSLVSRSNIFCFWNVVYVPQCGS